MLNEKLFKIEKEDAFSRSTRLVNEYKAAHPGREIISLGIGDVSFPVPGPVVDAIRAAVDDIADMEHFPGYGNYYGIPSLRKAIAENDYGGLGISPDEIFVGDGTKSDSTAILELFGSDVRILVGNPMYPIYRNGCYSLGRDVFEAQCGGDLKMTVPAEHYDVIYICSPCNPIGNAYTRDELARWIEYANDNGAYIIYDNVYHDFIRSGDVPDSIYELPGSRSCAVELRSYSKNASFSGVRCSYYVLPKEFGTEIRELWLERTLNRFNGASYLAQKGAEASYGKEAREIIKRNIAVYHANADLLRQELSALGFNVIGGVDAPYLFVQTPDRLECWEAFRVFLEEMNIVVVPGSIFGSKGRYYLRLSALGTPGNTKKAIERIKKFYEKDN